MLIPRCLLLALLGSLAGAAELVVDQHHQSAADTNPGTPDRPLATIGRAVQLAAPGDVISVRDGIYRESLRLRSNGEPDRPITLQAAGEHVVISGADAISGWAPCAVSHPHAKAIWQVALDWQPAAVFLDNQRLPRAQSPNHGWYIAAGGGSDTLQPGPAELAAVPDWVGGSLFFWDTDVTAQVRRPITSASGNLLQLDGVIYRDRVVEAGADRYRVENRLALIDQPGEWAYQDGTLYLWPPVGADLATSLVEGARRDRFVVEVGGARHWSFVGLEIRHGAAHGVGGWAGDPAGNSYRDCWIHDHAETGLYLRNQTGGSVTGCLITDNGNGVAVANSSQIVVAGNEIADNDYDGLLVSHGSRDVAIRRNFIHGHTRWGHPDNVQFYRDVSQVTVEENVLLDGGQAIMMEQVTDSRFLGNLVVGTHAVALIFGHNNVFDCELVGNTVAFTGWGCISLTGQRYTLRRNLLNPGTSSSILGVRDSAGFVSDGNLFFRPGLATGTMFSFGRNWLSDLAGFRQASGSDANSEFASPRFERAPNHCARIDGKRLTEATADTLPVADASRFFQVGDPIELRFDGVIRQVSAVTDTTVSFTPPTAGAPETAGLVLNWRGQEPGHLDLRPTAGSPALRLEAGSRLDLAAFRAGDSHGDGRPDIRRRR